MLNNFILPEWFEATSQLKNELLLFWNKSYYELYDDDFFDKSTLVKGELKSDIVKMLQLLSAQVNGEDFFKSFMYFNWSLCLAAKPRIDAYLSNVSEYQLILNDLEKWASGYGLSKEFCNYSLSRQKGSAVVSESTIAYINMLKIPKKDNIVAIVAKSIDCCLEGAGICEGTVDKRAIFNWLIIDVFPSAYHHRLPSLIYTEKFDIKNWTYFKEP
jgi:hypothetical protein